MKLPATPAWHVRDHRGFLRSSISRSFTLVELLVVIAMIVIMMALLVPAMTGIKGGQDVTKAAYDVSGVLEQARTYAIANNTYVWVGFFEEDGSQSSTIPATAGTGRGVMSVVASKDGTRYSDAAIDSTTPPAFGTEAATASPPRNQVQLVQIHRLVKLDNIHVGTLNDGLATGSGNSPSRPPVSDEYQVGDAGFAKHTTSASTSGFSVTNPTTFTYPLTVPGSTQIPQYTFVKIIEFNPQGEASKMLENTFTGLGPQSAIELGLQPTHGSVVDARYAGTIRAAAAIQIEGITGQVKMYRP